MQNSRPNVVMLVADDHESRAMGWAGNSIVQSPNLDRLAFEGSAFTRTYHMGGCDDAVCIPTRASLLTGMDFFHSMQGERGAIDPERVTLPQYFKQDGYHTFVTGKWHNDLASLTRSFSDGDAIFAGGMDDHYATPVRPFDPEGRFPDSEVQICPTFATDLFCDTAAEFIESYDQPQPFFLYAAFTAPHDPRTPPQASGNQYTADEMELPPNYLPEHPFDLGIRTIRDEMLLPYPRQPEQVREEISAYYGMITAMDTGIGRIIAALESSGQLENTIIVYTGDHGLAVGQHGLLGKQNLYEHSSRVPLIIRGPGVPQNQITHALAYSWDSFPTLCELCELTPPPDLDARSLVPVITGKTGIHRKTIVGLYQQHQRMITEDRWKLILSTANGTTHVQLFDLEHDPDEIHNHASHPDHIEQKDLLTKQLASSPAGLPLLLSHYWFSQ